MQILCLAEQIQFTEDVERALKQQHLLQLELNLTAKLEHYTTVDTSSVDQANKGVYSCQTCKSQSNLEELYALTCFL